MDLNESAEELAFRGTIRDFIATHLPGDLRDKIASGLRQTKADEARWQAILAQRGWGAPAWPVEYGGCGWSAAQRLIFEEEQAFAYCPHLSPIGTKLVGPVLIAFGTDEQKQRFLPPARLGTERWCQGYSETGAGSDLASLQSKAVLDGDHHYIVNGTKIWTSYGHESDYMFMLVRSDNTGRPQEGITVLLVDMLLDGISIRPIITLDMKHHLNEVHFDNVRVPVASRVGEQGKGWTYAKFLLGNERISAAQVAPSTHTLALLKRLAREEPDGRGESLSEDPMFRRKIVEVEIQLEALRATSQRALYEVETGTGRGGVTTLKSLGTAVSQKLSELLLETAGYYGLPYIHEAMYDGWQEDPVGRPYAKALFPNYMFHRADTVFGGTEEVQKNVIAKQVLGL